MVGWRDALSQCVAISPGRVKRKADGNNRTPRRGIPNPMTRVLYSDPGAGYLAHKADIDDAVARGLDSGR